MNNFFLASLTSIAFLSILDVLVSKSKNGKLVKTVISIVAVCMLLTPILSIVKNFSLSNINEIDYEKDYLELEGKIYTSNIKNVLLKAGYKVEGVEVEFSTENENSTLNKITIKFRNQVIIESGGHINMLDNVKTLLSGSINLDKVEVVIEEADWPRRQKKNIQKR